jgi:ribosomal protein S18 acetylase RimI-like enzyme
VKEAIHHRERIYWDAMVTLAPFTEKEFEPYLQQGIVRYAEENVKAGYWNASEAMEKSRSVHAKLLPEGFTTPNQYLFSIREPVRGEQVGAIWLSADTESATPSGFIYDLFIYEPFRRKGFATGAMLALEVKARELGLKFIYLHVFAHNPAAKSLYDKLGYGATGTNMAKPLTARKPA